MGTDVEVWSDDERGWTATRALFDEAESELSRFRSDSALSRVNAAPSGSVSVSGRLAEVFEDADEIRHLTEGLVDIGIGAAVGAWGYDTSIADVVDLDSAPTTRHPSSWSYSSGVLDRAPGVLLDLGGIGKGWTADAAVESGLALVVSAGGDMRSVHQGTTARIADPGGGVAARVALGVGALATSSTARRSWEVCGDRVSHIIDPRAGAPVVSPVVSATVVADTAVLAEAGAKAVLILGADGLAWADDRAWIRSAITIWADGAIYATSEAELVA